ncbi:hypothetical protein H4R21_002998 [Coemansia helicoidea]|uniref:Uncharacterized protein n=1 Tax=Coemansia helicoidea TaxID=1286919 RepID=A0ACC1L4R3_9FUNG|nr:hypothetical protein H4R21_002998 [Coemansia helicoidea]
MVAEVARLVVDCRQDQVEKIAAIARLLRANDVPEEDAIVAGLAEYAGQLEDIVLDAPHAFNRFGLLAAAVGVPPARMSQVLCSLSAGKSAAAVASAYLGRLAAVDGEHKTKAAVADAGLDVARFIGRADAVDATKKELNAHVLHGLFNA